MGIFTWDTVPFESIRRSRVTDPCAGTKFESCHQKVWSVGRQVCRTSGANHEPWTAYHELQTCTKCVNRIPACTVNLWRRWLSSMWLACPIATAVGGHLQLWKSPLHPWVHGAVAPCGIVRWAGAISVPAVQRHHNNMYITCFFGIPVRGPGPWFGLTFPMSDNREGTMETNHQQYYMDHCC